jgi:serine/threonine protein phosphatase PrpC
MRLGLSCYTVAAVTHRGSVRERNEDIFAVDELVCGGDMDEPSVLHLHPGFHLLMVADGMGGHSHGDVASRTAIEALVANREMLRDEATCAGALIAANERIYSLMRLQTDVVGMGTTIVGVALGRHAHIHFNVGDSRAYRHSPGRLVRLSEDDVPRNGTGTGRRLSHLLTQSLGGHAVHSRISPHIATVPPLEVGETLLLCSDGLTDMINEDEIFRILEATSNPQECARSLLDVTFRAGALDNVTMVIARAE